MLHVDKGAVQDLLKSPGWAIVVRLLDSYQNACYDALVGYLGSDPQVIKSKQIAVRSVKQMKDFLISDLNELAYGAEITEEVNNG